MAKYSKPCPFCFAPVTRKIGFTKRTGYQRYRCLVCEKCFSDSPFPKGSLPQGNTPKPKSIRDMRSRRELKRIAKEKPVVQLGEDYGDSKGQQQTINIISELS